MDRKNWPWKKKTPSFDETAMMQRLSPQCEDGDLRAELEKITAELIGKDEVINQHAKVAEEAVTGWERAEAEAKVSKQQSEALLEQVATMEERVSCLDAALKECTRQLRLARDDQGKKEAARWRYEAQVLSNELEIRSKERELSKKAAEAAAKQQLETTQKVVKLEAECQRLRLLLRKRLPGPAAMAQMKLEAAAEVGEKPSPPQRRQSPGRKSPSLTSFDSFRDSSEEVQQLKEILAKRTSELQSARLMCARTASKLSAVEEQLKVFTRIPPENGRTGSAESWASALMAELSQFPPSSSRVLDYSLDDFAEMEKLASSVSPRSHSHSEEKVIDIIEEENPNNNNNNNNSHLALSSSTTENSDNFPAPSPSCHSSESTSEEKLIVSTPSRSPSSVGLELAKAVHKVLALIDELAQADCLAFDNSPPHPNPIDSSKCSDFDASVHSLIDLCHGLLQGKVDAIDFMAEVASALDWLVNQLISSPEKSIKRRLDWNLSNTSSSTDSSASSKLAQELEVALSEKEALRFKLQMEVNRATAFEEETTRQISDASNEIFVWKEKATALKNELESITSEKSLLEGELSRSLVARADIKSQLEDSGKRVKQLESKLVTLEAELIEEQRQRRDAAIQLAELRLQWEGHLAGRADEGSLRESSSADEKMRIRKESEIVAAAEKLAECQETILVLDKQLKALGGGGVSRIPSSFHSTDSPVSTLMLDKMVIETSSKESTKADIENSSSSIDSSKPTSSGHVWPRSDKAQWQHKVDSQDTHNVPTNRGVEGEAPLTVLSSSTLSREKPSTGSFVREQDDAMPTIYHSSAYQSSPIRGPYHRHNLPSPARSPGRFLSLKTKNSAAKQAAADHSGELVASSSSLEKHGSGFIRFFQRSKTDR